MSFSLAELKNFAKKLPNHFYVVGSVVREKKNPHDLDLICLHDLKEDYKWFQKHYEVSKPLRLGKEILTFKLKLNGKPLKINIWHGTKENLLFMGLAYSYPRVFNIALRKKAKTMGYLLNQNGLYKNNKKVPVKNIKMLFRILKIDYRTPAQEEKKLYGDGLATYLFKKFANIYRRKYCNGKSRDLEEGELHPLCANYCGPGTRIDVPKYRNYPPYNQVDEVCRIHDLKYEQAGNYPEPIREQRIRKADEEMINSLEKFKDLEPYYSIAKYAILTKMKFEDWLPMVAKLLFIERYGQP